MGLPVNAVSMLAQRTDVRSRRELVAAKIMLRSLRIVPSPKSLNSLRPAAATGST